MSMATWRKGLEDYETRRIDYKALFTRWNLGNGLWVIRANLYGGMPRSFAVARYRSRRANHRDLLANPQMYKFPVVPGELQAKYAEFYRSGGHFYEQDRQPGGN